MTPLGAGPPFWRRRCVGACRSFVWIFRHASGWVRLLVRSEGKGATDCVGGSSGGLWGWSELSAAAAARWCPLLASPLEVFLLSCLFLLKEAPWVDKD